MRHYTRKKAGFTIVELLIVIVVIAILAAITIVAYTGIQERARTSAQLSELSQLQRTIQVDVLQTTGTEISIGTPVVYAQGATGSFPLSTPIESAQEITLYGVFDSGNTLTAYDWWTIISLSPNSTNNSLRIRTGASGSNTARIYHAASSYTNRDLTQSGVLNNTARHIGWAATTASTVYGGFDNGPVLSNSIPAHTGRSFVSVDHNSTAGFTSVASLVFSEYHDAQTRTAIIQWLNEEYNVGL